MSYKRILTIQDISCVGQCSMTVALPILSACGCETCVLPSAVLSTHTGGFSVPTFRDLTEDIPAIRKHWQREGIHFDAIYTGYLGSAKQIAYVKDIFAAMTAPGGMTVVDPAMADNGKLYRGFDEAYVREMAELCAVSDVVLPNLTEACMLTGSDYSERYEQADILALCRALAALGAKTVVLTGVGYTQGQTGVAIYRDGELWHYHHPKIDRSYHGTGDIFASAFVGSWMRTGSMKKAAAIASDFTAAAIRNTYHDPAHWYGVKFETALPELLRLLDCGTVPPCE